MGIVRRSTLDDARYIAPRLREADKRECDALLALPPELVLPEAVCAPTRRVWTFATDAGEPVGLFGLDATPIPQVGTIWMVSTPVINKHPQEFLRGSIRVVTAMNNEYPILTNMMDERNTLHKKWLRWLGFSFLRRIDRWGARSVPFLEFARLKRTCA